MRSRYPRNRYQSARERYCLNESDKRFLSPVEVANHDEIVFVSRRDTAPQDDAPVAAGADSGTHDRKNVVSKDEIVRMKFTGFGGRFLLGYERACAFPGSILREVRLRRSSPDSRRKRTGSSSPAILASLIALLLATPIRAQVAVDTDPSTSTSADLVGSGVKTLTFNHSTTATANRVLLVGVSMNIANATTSSVSGITYNGTALTFLGAHNDAANQRRVEQWYLLNPASGTNLPIVVSVNIPSAVTVGVVAGATVFTGADQTTPLSSFVSADGPVPSSNSQMNVPSVINGMVFDTLAVGLNAVTVNGPQVSQWNAASGGATPDAAQDISASASSRSGAPSVPISESFNENLSLTQVVPDGTTFNLTSVAPTTAALTLTSVAPTTISLNMTQVAPSTTALTLTSVATSTTPLTLTAVAPTTIVLNLTAAAKAGANTIYTGTITNGANNAYAGTTVTVAGFVFPDGADNGTFTCIASTATSITLNNANGVAATHAATATVKATLYNGTITGGAANAYADDTAVVAGFKTAANNGTFVVLASTATTITAANSAGVAETDPGTATVPDAVYTGTITGGAGNAYAGKSVTIAGFTTAADNGTFTVIASTATTMTLANPAAVAQTHAGTATVGDGVYTGTITGGTGNAYAGDTVTIAGFTNAGNNGTFTVIGSTATALTLANPSAVAETDPAIATVPATIYTGTITGGAGSAYAGGSIVIAGFTNATNNGTFPATASTATTITVANPAGISETHAGTATVPATVYTGTITGGAANAFLGDTVVTSGFVNAVNNGTFVALASSATTITVNNISGIAETDQGTATVSSASGSSTVYTGTITGGENNGFAGDSFTISGFTNAGNNGTFTCTASTSTTLTCTNTGGVAETHAGAAATSSTSNWSLGAVSINPTAADIGVTTSVGSAVFLGQSTTYTISVFNNGTSTANTVTLSDTLASGMTLNSVTTTVGTCNSTGNPVTCAFGNMAPGANITVTIVETATASGSFTNTAVVSDSGTPPDPDTGNNTYVAVATVQAVACATVSQATAGTNLTGTLNTYYPGTANVAAGAKSIPVGTPTGAGAAIAAGNLLLVIQMQDATIDVANSVAYGNGYTGQGFTALNSAGDYEFVTATGPVAGGFVPISGSGTGNGLVFSYHSAAASATAGQSTYQVIVVPQYTTASFNATTPPTALAWNGSTGGVLVLDTSQTLTLNGATLSVNGMGFRGGAGLQLDGGVGGNNTDYFHAAPSTYAGVVENGVDAAKGEGIAGTPLWVESGGTYLQTTSDYPSGTAGTDGSSARGAPGNGGGGGTDGDPTNNDQNAGGGGGGNGGMGGFGGDSWNTNLSVGGEGGGAFPATINRIAMGGGGGAGTRNNSDGDNQASGGAAGGGIIIIRTYGLSGTGTLTANGSSAYNGTANDAGGGAGAGGSIVVLSANGGESGLTLQANGGRGGDAWDSQSYSIGNRHGPGGGGGGGAIFVSGTPASISVAGGTSGTTLTPGVTYGATTGANGATVTNASLTQTSGTLSGAQCTPDMTVAKAESASFVRGSTASYTLTASNISPYGPSSAAVTVNDILPNGIVPTSASGTGWSCSIASQTVSCTDSTVLAANSSYPAITINATVSQSAPSSVSNDAVVGGGGEVNIANDTSNIVTANVTSSADLSMSNVASPDPVAAGSNITYSQVINNAGPSAADNATLVESIPANTTFVSLASPSGWACTTPAVGGTGNVLCSNVTLSGNTSATFSLVVKVAAGTTSGTVITNTATASSSTSDPNSTNNTAVASTIVGTTAQAEMVVTNAETPDPVIAGNNITYTQTATNVGAAQATNPTFSENTPNNTTFVSITPPPGTTCTTPGVGSAGAISCTAPAAPAGTSGSVVLVVQVAAGTASGTVITDTVTVNSANQAFGANSATITDVVATATQADVALATTATPLTLIAGNNITYTQTITNNGPATASSVTFTEAIPTNTTFVSVSAPAGWTCTETTSVTCTTASLAASDSANILVSFNVAPTVAAGTIVANSSVSATTSDPNSSNNSTSISTPLTNECDLAVTNSGSPSPVLAGGNITYTQVVTNSGPSNCSTATFTEATPANTTFVSVSATTTGGGAWTCPNTAPISCTNPSVPPNSVGTITAVYQVAAGTAAGTIITDTAKVNEATSDSNFNNNTATSTIGVASAAEADLSITNTGAPNPVNAGQNIIFSQSVTNAGPASASTVALTETLPANTTFVSLTGSAGWTCTSAAPYTCSIASLAATATGTFSFIVQVTNSVAAGTAITDAASVASSVTVDPNSGNNSASSTVYVNDSADLSVTNTGTPVPVQAGNNITYAQSVTNAGPSVATAATFTEATPANTTFVSLTPIPSGWSCTLPTAGSAGTITCTDPSFAAGTVSFPVILKVTAGTAAGTAISDVATVGSATSDPNGSNNSATANDVVATATEADLVVTNSASPTSVAAGSNVTYTQSVTNNGPAVAATGTTFTQSTPPNTTFQSFTPPATGWICTTPAVGSAGTITCTATGTLGVNATANFTLVLQVVAGTASGTSIPETATATVSNIVPNLTSNTATATVIVANANSADLAIVKTASPSPTVVDGDTLTYSLAVTNNGPASATNVTVTDTLPSDVTYLSATATQGNCSEANGTVTCLLGTMANAGTATVSILTLAGSPGTLSNTAKVSADQTDSNQSNNTSTQSEIVTTSTHIQLHALSARMVRDKTGLNHAVIFWKTGAETHNLGFNIYRDQSGQRVRVNPSLIAGSALVMRGALPRHSAKTYSWVDSSSSAGGGSYWLEDVDVNGTRTMHGPVSVDSSTSSASSSESVPATSSMLNQLGESQPSASGSQGSHRVENVLRAFIPTPAQRQLQFALAAAPAVKIYVQHEGWHRVTQPQLVQAGLDPNVDPALLHLYAEAIEQPMVITGASSGPGGFGPQASIQFYGTGIDTPFTGTRVYWLVSGETPGLRIPQLPALAGSNQPPTSFPAEVVITPKTTYFSALLTNNGNNFFGPLVSSTPLDVTLTTPLSDPDASASPQLKVTLQGVVLGFPHDVSVAINGTTLGEINFTGQAQGNFTATLAPGILQEGSNTVTLTAQDGDYDMSLVQSIGIEYPHLYVAESDGLKFTAAAGEEVAVTGFTSTPSVVVDVTNPAQPIQLTPQIARVSGSNPTQYQLQVQVPWSAGPSSGSQHTLIALAADRIDSVAGIRANQPSHWHSPQQGSDIVMISAGAFAESLRPLIREHEGQGKSTSLILIDQLYDEFTFGEHNPYAIKAFLQTASKAWKTPPHYMLLNGRASLDPRNYLGFGYLDFVPTAIVSATGMMTASDDWFSDFSNTGMPTVATGRLPVSTVEEANLVAGKLSSYESQSTNGAWTSQALMVADVNENENFTQDSELVQAQLPPVIQPTDVFASGMSISQAQQDIVADINAGQILVNYAGHGSEDQWSGDDLFDNTAATGLTNGTALPVFLIMDCLNGLFQDVYEQPLAVTLMLAPNGGAVAVLASSGLNQPSPQTKLDSLIVQNAFNPPYPALGDAILKAKAAINDLSVRKTFNLLGDPAMQIKPPAPSANSH